MRKHSRKKAALWILLFISLLVTPFSSCFTESAKAAAGGAQSELPSPGLAAKAEAGKQGGGAPGQAKKSSGPEADQTEPENVPIPINSEMIDEAGQALGKKIDQVGRGASKRFGGWIDATAFNGITWLKLLICLGLVLLVMAFNQAVHHIIFLKLKRSAAKGEPKWDDLLLNALAKPVSMFVLVYGIYWALSPVWGHFDQPGGVNLVHRAVSKAADIGGMVAFFWFIYQFIQVLDLQVRKWTVSTSNTINDMLMPMISRIVKGFVVVVGGLMIIQNMTGIEVGPLVASLGIGGLAFALAGKDSIANFLGSLTILLDKPFQVGERIMIDKHEGFVEGVGFRSTRIRTLTGHIVSIPNEKIINSTLENIGRRAYLRWHTSIGLSCATPPEKVDRAVELIREILQNHEGMRQDYPPRVHFNGFNDWSLNISIFAWYFPADHWKHQDWLQGTCLQIMHSFREEGLEMAYPTQTVYQFEPEKQMDLDAALNIPFRGKM